MLWLSAVIPVDVGSAQAPHTPQYGSSDVSRASADVIVVGLDGTELLAVYCRPAPAS